MSLVIPTGVTPSPFRGERIGKLVSNCLRSKYPPKTIPVVIDWSLYPQIGSGKYVAVNVEAVGGVINPIDVITSVHVDNLGVDSSVRLIFPDTNFQLSCGGNETFSGPVITFQLQFNVLNAGLTGVTTIFVNNFPIDAITNATFLQVNAFDYQTPTVVGVRTFGLPALGDKQIDILFTINGFVTSTLLPAVVGSQVYYITDILFQALGVYGVGSINPAQFNIIQGANTLYKFPWYVRSDMQDFSLMEIAHLEGLQEIYPSTTAIQLQQISGTGLPGFVKITIHYTRVDDL